jgi:hypothetical protein
MEQWEGEHKKNRHAGKSGCKLEVVRVQVRADLEG